MNKRILKNFITFNKNNYIKSKHVPSLPDLELKNRFTITQDEKGKITTERILQDFSKVSSFQYKSRYPDKKIEDFEQALKQLYATQDTSFDFDLLYEFASENLGYSKEYLKQLIYGERKPYFTIEKDGSTTILWSNIKADINNDLHKQQWEEIETAYNGITQFAEHCIKLKEKFQR
jgi:hypothetical protein